MNKFGEEYKKEYYLKNKDKWLVEIHCEACNTHFKRRDRTHHLKSKKHIINVKLNDFETLKRSLSSLCSTVN